MTPRPPFDPELAAAWRARPGLTSLLPEQIGEVRAAEPAPTRLDPDSDAGAGFDVTNHQAPGASGGPGVDILLLRPRGLAGPVPCLYHLHGGGLVAGNRWDDVVPLLEMARETGCAIASAEYRLAPEHPYPAALRDATAGLRWLVDHAPELALDPDAVVIEGISGGGGLAAATVLWNRDHDGPPLLGQLLICPMLDDRNDSTSAHQMAGLGSWDRTANATAWEAYLGDAVAGPEVPVYAAAGRATDLRRLPPTFLDVGSAETFRDEVIRYADRLWQAGGDAELHVWPGAFHGFDYAVPGAAVSRAARVARTSWLTRLLARRPLA